MTTNENPAAVRVCAIANIQCSRGCGTGACKREQPAAAPIDDKLERPARVGGRNYVAGELKQQVLGRAYAEYDRWVHSASACKRCGATTAKACNDVGCFYLESGDGEPTPAPADERAAGLIEQHHRDSAELRRVCEARDEARRTAEYWKAEHNAANARIAELERASASETGAEGAKLTRYAPGIALDKVRGGDVAVMYSRADGEYVKLSDVLRSPAMATEAVAISDHDLSTSAGGLGYIAEFFAKRLRRHDFGRYIHERLAADFACALAQYLRDRDAAPPPAQADARVGLTAQGSTIIDALKQAGLFLKDYEPETIRSVIQDLLKRAAHPGQPEPRAEVTALIAAAEHVVSADRACALDESDINALATAIDAARIGGSR